MQKELVTKSYDFELPSHLIAKYPVNPRDSAKLLVYDRQTDTIIHTIFKELHDYVADDVAFVFNNTKVIKARLFGKKQSGGRVELLLNKPLDAYNVSVFIRGKVKVGTKLFFDPISAEVVELLEDGSRVVQFFSNTQALRFEELLPYLEKIGHIPLPPYMQREDEALDEKEYQSVFAKYEGAIAAPTASLHFTKELFEATQKRYETHEVTLHVGAGTFKPVESEIITEHPMHSEYYEIPQSTQELLDSSKKILAVGTTVTRTIEYYARKKQPKGEANLFLHPNNPPIRVSHLLTNFHLPKSTLLMLVASFVGLDKTLELYHEAIAKEYRFYSYGDAMLIL